MRRYARIFEGRVFELFDTPDDITQMFHADLIWIDVTDISPAPQCEWSAIETEGVWSFAQPVIAPPTEAEVRAMFTLKRAELLTSANAATAGMADAFIAGLLDEADTAKFKAYAAYKLALNKIDQAPGFPQVIAWPEPVTDTGVAQ